MITVSRLSRFRSGVGQVSPYDGNVYGFLGEVEEGQLPPFMKLPDALSLRQALAARDVRVASRERLIAWYGEGLGNPRVPIQGDELVTDDPVEEQELAQVPLLQYVPAAWAPYFMAAQTPEAALRLVWRLAAENVTGSQNRSTSGLERWARAACMRAGPVGVNRYRSKLHMTWVTPRATLDRSLTRWATRRLSPFVTVPAILPAAVAAMPPPIMGGGTACRPRLGRDRACSHMRLARRKSIARWSMNGSAWRADWIRQTTKLGARPSMP